MKKINIWTISVVLAGALALAHGLPFAQHNTEQLLPLRTVQVELTDAGVHIVSEAGEARGASWSEAVAALHEGAAGEVFFDTAEQLVLCSRALNIVPEILEDETMRPAAQVYRSNRIWAVEGLNEYLSSQESGVTLGDLRAALAEGTRMEPPLLRERDGEREVLQ